jgi:hypothetical protein
VRGIELGGRSDRDTIKSASASWLDIAPTNLGGNYGYSEVDGCALIPWPDLNH